MISLFFISILSILTIISINSIDFAHAQFNETQSLQVNPGNIEPQPLVNAKTGQDLALPGTQIAVRDPDTGQISTKEVKFIPPKVTGSSITTSINKTGQSLN